MRPKLHQAASGAGGETTATLNESRGEKFFQRNGFGKGAGCVFSKNFNLQVNTMTIETHEGASNLVDVQTIDANIHVELKICHEG